MWIWLAGGFSNGKQHYLFLKMDMEKWIFLPWYRSSYHIFQACPLFLPCFGFITASLASPVIDLQQSNKVKPDFPKVTEFPCQMSHPVSRLQRLPVYISKAITRTQQMQERFSKSVCFTTPKIPDTGFMNQSRTNQPSSLPSCPQGAPLAETLLQPQVAFVNAAQWSHEDCGKFGQPSRVKLG